MKSRASELAVGVFVILFGIALFFLAMRVSGLVGNTMKDPYEMTAVFENVNGIKPRAKVAMSGVKIGQVDEELRYSSDYAAADAAQQKAMEKQLIDNMKSITNIDEDAYIMVATNGLLGEKYLKIIPGGGLNYLKRGDRIANTQGTMEIEDLVTKFVTGGAGKSSENSSSAPASSDKASAEPADAEPAFVE